MIRHIPLLRRPFWQRDQAVIERARAIAEKDELRKSLMGQLDQARAERDAAFVERDAAIAKRDGLLRSFIETESGEIPPTPFSRTQAPDEIDDADLVARIITAYRKSIATMRGPSNSFWETAFADLKRDVHEALVVGDATAVQRMLREPKTTDLFYGFDNMCRSVDTDQPRWEPISVESYRDILLLCEVIGARKLWNPLHSTTVHLPLIENLLLSLDDALSFKVRFPNPFPGEIGLATTRGTISYRAVQALYQAWRISKLSTGKRVVEIGGGLGRTALYTWHSGLRDYTLIDLPLTGVAQAYFLGRTLGPDVICLFGEERPGIRVLPPSAFLEAGDRYELVVNVDSLTEMARGTALAYVRAIRQRAVAFLSINHEANEFATREICAEVGEMPAFSRTPYWLRRGYVEELFMPAARGLPSQSNKTAAPPLA